MTPHRLDAASGACTNARPVLTLVAVAAAILWNAGAHAVPSFTSSALLHDQDSAQVEIIHPAAGLLNETRIHSGEHLHYGYTPPVALPYSSQLSVTTGFGPGVGASGVRDIGRVTFTAAAEGYRASAAGSGQVDFYFSIDGIQPVGVPAYKIPVKVTGTMQVDVEMRNTSWPDLGQATTTFGIGVLGGQIQSIATISRSTPGSFSETDSVRQSLWVGEIGHVQLIASGYTSTENGRVATVARIDPILEFDQAAFDSEMGMASFPLAEVYRLGVSPNVPVPEPGVTALMGFGLMAVAGWTLRKRRAQAMMGESRALRTN